MLRQREHALIDEGVVHDHIGLREAGERVDGQQPGIARSGAGKPDVSTFEHHHAVEQLGEGVRLCHQVTFPR